MAKSKIIILFLIVTAIMTVLIFPASANDITIDKGVNSYTVKGVIDNPEENSQVTLTIYNITEGDKNTITDAVWINTVSADDNGNFTFTIKGIDALTLGKYKIKISAPALDNPIIKLFNNSGDINNVLAVINNATDADSLKTLLAGSDTRLALEYDDVDFSGYDSESDSVKDSVCAELLLTDFTSSAQFNSSINEIAFLLNANSTISALKAANNKYSTYSLLKPAYLQVICANMSEEGKANTLSALFDKLYEKKPFVSIKDIREKLAQRDLYYNKDVAFTIAKAIKHTEVKAFFDEFKDVISSSLVIKYNKLSASQKYEINKLIVQNSCKTFDDFESYINSLIDSLKPEKGRDSFSGGGGSGSKITGTGTIIPPVEKEENPKGNSSVSFNDLDTVQWSVASIQRLVDKKIISGKSEGVFDPAGNITRAEFTKMIVALFNILNNSAKSSFNDVSESDWYYKFLSSAYEKGIITGTQDDTFYPNSFITREDIAVILCRAAKSTGVELKEKNESYFIDFDSISDYAIQSVKLLKSNSILNGTPDGSFMPKAYCTRAEAAVALDNFIQLKSE